MQSEGQIGQTMPGDFTLGGKKAAQVLTLAAGGDNQAHVTRPRTASVQGIKNNLLIKRVNSQLETITENGGAEEDNIAVSQGQQPHILHGQFDIEASHSFSLRTYGKDKAS